MKKFIIIVCSVIYLCLLSMSGSAQTEKADTSQSDVMVIYKDAKAGLDSLVQTLGRVSDHSYSIMVRESRVKAIGDIIWVVILISLTLICATIFYKRERYIHIKDHPWYQDTWDEHITIIISFIAGLVFLVTLLIVAANVWEDIIMGLFNPEYGAIKEVIKIVK